MQALFDLEGIAPELRRVAAAGTDIHYLEMGAGPALILLHGGSGGGANWYRVMGPLSRHFRVLAPDFPGFGLTAGIESGRPLGVRGAEIVDSWLAALDVEACGVAGTSFGGLVALRLGQRAARARAVALIDAAGLGPELPQRARLATLPLLARLLTYPSRNGTRWLLRNLLTSGPGALPPAHEDALVEFLFQSARAGRSGEFARAFRHFAGPLGQRDVLADAELRSYPVPALVVWGAADRFLPPLHAARGALMPDAETHVLPAAGHSPNWEKPAELAALLTPFFTAHLPAPSEAEGSA